MRHEKYLAYAAAGMPLAEILTRFEQDLMQALADADADFEEVYGSDIE